MDYKQRYLEKFGEKYVESKEVAQLKEGLPKSMLVYSEPWGDWATKFVFIWTPTQELGELVYETIQTTRSVDTHLWLPYLRNKVRVVFGTKIVEILTEKENAKETS